MNRYPKGLSVLFLLFFLFSQALTAQTQLGLRLQLNSEQSVDELTQEFELIKKLGIQWIEIEGIPNSEVLLNLNQDSISVYLLSDIQYVLTDYLLEDSELGSKLTGLIEEQDDNSFSGYALLRNSQTYKERFSENLQILSDSIRVLTEKELIIHTPLYENSNQAYSFLDRVIIDLKSDTDYTFGLPYVMLNESNYTEGDEVMINRLAESKPNLLILHSNWLIQASDRNPGLIDMLSGYSQQNSAVPIPKNQTSAPNSNWNVFVLLLLWITIITHYAYHPNYKANAFRYFFSHNYFVKDIMEYRIRNTSNGIIILIQHAVSGGLFFYYIFRASFTDAGLKSFFSNLPFVSFIGDTFLSVFILGLLVVAIFQIIAIIWISLANKEIRHSSQILSLYSWPLQLNFIALTIISVLFQKGSTEVWFYVLAVFFVVNWFNAFNLAAVDTAKFKIGGRTVYALLTIVLHLLVTAIAVTLLYLFTPVFQAIELAFFLP